MKKIISFLIVISTILFAFTTYSQNTASGAKSEITKKKLLKMIVRSAPGLTLQLSGSYNYGIYELSGNDNGDINGEELLQGENFGVRHGGGLSVTVKIPLHSEGNIRLNISGNYNYFSSELSKLNTGKYQSSFAKYNVFSGIVGIENNFTPNCRFKTLVGVGLVASFISGKLKIADETTNMNIKVMPAFRMGISVTSGFEYLLTDNFGFNCGLKFTHANLWFKSSKQSADPNSVYLDDQRATPRFPFSGFKQFAWGSFYAGINLFFGIEKKEYYFKR